MGLIYHIGIYAYGLVLRLAALFNAKARLWVNGRKGQWERLRKFDAEGLPVYWFHCASLGEFEQGRPVMEALKKKADIKIVVSFFSPSGYEIRKNYQGADLIFYLPLDTPKNAKRLMSILKPSQVFFVKYEFWANYIFAIKQTTAKLYLISGIFRSDQIFFKQWGTFFKKVLLSFDKIYVQNEASELLLKSIGVQSILSGDTRYDRVIQNAKKVKEVKVVADFLEGAQAFVVGSSWAEDDAILFPLVKTGVDEKIIIAPHEINESRLQTIEKGLGVKSIRFSSYTNQSDAQVLIIDNIGLLMHIYQYAKVAYVGGGFRTGLHNILEPACFGVPVIFGPKHDKFPEANLFIDQGIGFEVRDVAGLKEVYNQLLTCDYKSKVVSVIEANTGATETILSSI